MSLFPTPKAETVMMSNCCYSAPMLVSARTFWCEFLIALDKVLTATGRAATELWASGPILFLLHQWAGGDLLRKCRGLTIHRSDRLENQVIVRAPAGRMGIPGRYATLFIDRPIYDGLGIDTQVDTVKLPIVPRGTHGEDQSKDRQRRPPG